MIYVIANQKGGTGKSTTAAALATGANYMGKKSLVIDLDPQGNLSYSMGGNTLDAGAYDLLTGQATAGEVIQHTDQGDIITSSIALAGADSTLTGDRRIFALRDALKPVKKKYDLIVIDTQPTLGTLLINALTAADKIIIPLQADVYCLQGLSLLVQTINNVQQSYNHNLKIAGILFTKYSSRTLLAREFTDTISDQAVGWDIPILHTTIREGVAVREAQTLRQSLFEYAPHSKPAEDYLNLIKELNI